MAVFPASGGEKRINTAFVSVKKQFNHQFPNVYLYFTIPHIKNQVCRRYFFFVPSRMEGASSLSRSMRFCIHLGILITSIIAIVSTAMNRLGI